MFLNNSANVDQQVTAVRRLRGFYDSSILDAAKKMTIGHQYRTLRVTQRLGYGNGNAIDVDGPRPVCLVNAGAVYLQL